MAVIQTGSFEGASKNLFITPSAVSLRIQALEEAMGCTLVHRTRPCTATTAGQKLLDYLRTTNRLQQDLLDSLAGLNEQNMQKLIIASNADSLATWLLPTLRQTLIQEKIVLHIEIDDQAQTHHLLKSGVVNACISAEPSSLQGCQALYLGEMRYQLVATESFVKRWFACTEKYNGTDIDIDIDIDRIKQRLTRQELQNAPAVIFNDKDELHFEYLQQNFGLLKGSYPHHTVPSSESFFSAIKHGLGYGFVPELQLVEHLTIANLAIANTKTSSTSLNTMVLLNESIDISLYWHHWKTQSQALNILTQALLNNSKKYLQ